MTGRLASALDAYEAARSAVARRLAELPDADGTRPSVLPGWDVRTLVGHVVLVHEGLGRVLARPTTVTAVPAAELVRRYRRDVEAIAASTREATGDHPVSVLADRLTAPVTVPDATTERTVLDGPRGPVTALDWVLGRVLELVVHADDLDRSLPERAAATPPRPALAAAVRWSAEVLAIQAPGRSVEVRVPPFVAVQAVAGPRHTRGTPPNVVETDPLTWLRVATGRQDVAAVTASGDWRATGPRSDLSGVLPLLT